MTSHRRAITMIVQEGVPGLQANNGGTGTSVASFIRQWGERDSNTYISSSHAQRPPSEVQAQDFFPGTVQV